MKAWQVKQIDKVIDTMVDKYKHHGKDDRKTLEEWWGKNECSKVTN